MQHGDKTRSKRVPGCGSSREPLAYEAAYQMHLKVLAKRDTVLHLYKPHLPHFPCGMSRSHRREDSRHDSMHLRIVAHHSG